MSEGVSVKGGADGIEAQLEDLVVAGRMFAATAQTVAEVADICRGCSMSLFAGPASVDWHGLLVAQDSLQAAVDSLAAAESGSSLLSRSLGRAALEYHTCDRGPGNVEWLFDNLLGTIKGWPVASLRAQAVLLGGGSLSRTAQTLLTADPQLMDVLTTGSAAMAAELAFLSLLADGNAAVTAAGEDTTDAAVTPPRCLADLLGALALRNTGAHGEVDVRFLSGAAGRRRVIVDIPGTKDWKLDAKNPDITSLATNVRAVSGRQTSYERGVLQAMKQAGVGPRDEVLLVGHSEGGMVAVRTAQDATTRGQFNVTHVLTAGAPVGRTVGAVPKSVQVLALENREDVVPHLDGADNPDRANVTTVTVHRGDGSIGGNHDLDETYLPGAADADAAASTDPALRAFLSGASGYLDARAVRTERYVITRRY
ncbi:MAG: hypothetical protein ACR2LF_11940 [Jatrophihabitantaceae bacterium]